MIIILAEGQGFNNSWDKPRPAKNWTALLRVHLSQFTFNETGQRLSGHLETGSSSPMIHAVMFAQFWTRTWAQIPHCTYCVDLYLVWLWEGASRALAAKLRLLMRPVHCPAPWAHLTDRSLCEPWPPKPQPRLCPSGSVRTNVRCAYRQQSRQGAKGWVS